MPPRRYQPRRGPRPQRRRDGGAEGGLAVETQVVVPRGGAPVELPSSIAVKDLATALTVSTADVIKELIRNGIFATINQSIDFDTASLVAGELGIETVERGVARARRRRRRCRAGDRGSRQRGGGGRQEGPLHRGGGGRPRHPRPDRHDHGPRRPRQDEPARRDPQHAPSRRGSGAGSPSTSARPRRSTTASGSSSSTRPATRPSPPCAPAARR